MNFHSDFSSRRILEDLPRKHVRFDTPAISGDTKYPQVIQETRDVMNSSKMTQKTFRQANHIEEVRKPNNPGGSILNDQNYLPPIIFRHGPNFLSTFKDNAVPTPCRDLELSILEPASKENKSYDGENIQQPLSQASLNQKNQFFAAATPFDASSLGQHSFPNIPADIATAAANSSKQFYNNDKTNDSFGFFTVPNSKNFSNDFQLMPSSSVASSRNNAPDNHFGENKNTYPTEKPIQNIASCNSKFESMSCSHQSHSIQKEIVCNSNKCCMQRVECCNSYETATNHRYSGCNCCNVSCNCCRKCSCSNVVSHDSPIINTKDLASSDNGIETKRRSIELRLQSCLEDERLPPKNTVESNASTDNKPSVSDLYEIIKMQNEQLKLLQQRVDDLLTVKKNETALPIESSKTIKTQDLNLNSVEQSMHKISIGVMTSFEVVMSSNVVCSKNDVYVQKETNFKCSAERNTQNSNDERNMIDNKSDGVNFLDGIEHCNKNAANCGENGNDGLILINDEVQMNKNAEEGCGRNVTEEKRRLPEKDPLDLSGVNFDNNPDLQPNLGWTFYNNVMNRVNHKLQSPPDKRDAEKCSPLARNLYMQQIAKAQRVAMDTLPEIQPQFPAGYAYQYGKPMSETSLHMKQLAAKYLGNGGNMQMSPQPSPVLPQQNIAYPMDQRNEMSFATLQYMERYQLLSVGNQNFQPEVAPRTPINMPQRSPHYLNPIYKNPSRILDITVLKQQPKLM